MPLLAVVALLQVTVAPQITILGAKPDFMLLAVVAWSLLRGTGEGIIWGFVGGLCLSLFSGGPFALPALALIAVGFFSGLGHTNIYRSQIALPLVTTLVATLIYGAFSLFLLYITGHAVGATGRSPLLDTLLRVMLPSMVFNGLLIIPVYVAFRWLHHRTGHEELRW